MARDEDEGPSSPSVKGNQNLHASESRLRNLQSLKKNYENAKFWSSQLNLAADEMDMEDITLESENESVWLGSALKLDNEEGTIAAVFKKIKQCAAKEGDGSGATFDFPKVVKEKTIKTPSRIRGENDAKLAKRTTQEAEEAAMDQVLSCLPYKVRAHFTNRAYFLDASTGLVETAGPRRQRKKLWRQVVVASLQAEHMTLLDRAPTGDFHYITSEVTRGQLGTKKLSQTDITGLLHGPGRKWRRAPSWTP